MKLIHYTSNPFVFDPSRTYVQNGTFKPHGLWVSVESDDKDGWADWCRGEDFRLETLNHQAEIMVDLSRVLQLTDVEMLDVFTKEFGERDGIRHIDWFRVRQLHAGIVIAPYQWSRRHKHMWYYPWDCASGCIWDLTAIERVVRL